MFQHALADFSLILSLSLPHWMCLYRSDTQLETCIKMYLQMILFLTLTYTGMLRKNGDWESLSESLWCEPVHLPWAMARHTECSGITAGEQPLKKHLPHLPGTSIRQHQENRKNYLHTLIHSTCLFKDEQHTCFLLEPPEDHPAQGCILAQLCTD